MSRFSGRHAAALVGALLATAATQARAADERYIVGLRDDAAGRAAVLRSGGEILVELGPQRALGVRLPAAAVDALRRNPNVAYVEDDPRREPLAQTTPYGIDLVQAPLVWPTTAGGNRTVCIIDSGLYVRHDDIQDSNVGGYPQDWATDRCGHGTHVAGTVAALDDTVGVVGVAPGRPRLHVVKVFGDNCRWTYASTLVDALNRCRTAGANVVSMSLGGDVSSSTESRAFADAWSAGLLSVAAAGNDGSSRRSYPASYDSVISVAAVDASGNVASFSQHNDQVDLAAPGVAVRSTVSWMDENSVTVNGTLREGTWIEGAARSTGSAGRLVDGGLCGSTGAWSGAVVLCERGGDLTFATKVANVRAGGGVAAVIYNNVDGIFSGTLGTGTTSTIPAIGLSRADGLALRAFFGSSATVRSVYEAEGSGYETWDGTSMATPHVSGVAALVWSADTTWTNAQIRAALEQTARDLGASGRDPYYGHGLVQAKAALDLLQSGTTPPPPPPPPAEITLQARGYMVKNRAKADLTWSGATSAQVDVLRDGRVVTTTANDGAYTDNLGRVTGTFRYRVCHAGTKVCSNEASVVVP